MVMEVVGVINRRAQVDMVDHAKKIEVEGMKVAKRKVVCMGVVTTIMEIIIILVKDMKEIIIMIAATEEITMVTRTETMILETNLEVEPVSNVTKKVIWPENVQIQTLVVIEEAVVVIDLQDVRVL